VSLEAVTRFELPAELAWVLRPEVAALTVEIAEAVEAEDPGIAGPGLRMGVGEALRQFVDDVELGHEARPRKLFFNFGRTEMRAGRELDGLLAAYRLGGRLAWRRFAAAGSRARVSPPTLHALAEAVFSWVDELSDQSAAGFAQERSAAASAAQLRRERLVRLLVAEPSPAAAAVEAAAAQAQWPLPALVAVACVADPQGGLPAALAPGVLAAPVGEALCVVLPDPASAERPLAALVARRGLVAALGPAVPWRRAALSWRRAQATHALAARAVIAPPSSRAPTDRHPSAARGRSAAAPGLVRADDHPELLVLAADPELAEELAARMLAPLAQLTSRQRERFAATLACWLGHRGALRPIAAELGVHPQTVRYRVARLRELFGEAALEDPASRFRLELALRARGMAGAAQLPG
jgi:PucR C-terminal helix-turn-helix domain